MLRDDIASGIEILLSTGIEILLSTGILSQINLA